MSYEAYWISPEGIIIPLEYSYSTHIDVLIDKKYSRLFGISRKKIARTFRKYSEPPGHEGYAREVLIETALKKGWLRLRFFPRKGSWTIQFAGKDLTEKQQAFIAAWAFLSTGNKYHKQKPFAADNEYRGVQIKNCAGEVRHETTINEIKQGSVEGNRGAAPFNDLADYTVTFMHLNELENADSKII